MDAIAFARELAADHPAAKLPCPVCAASVNAENLGRHLDKVHASARAGTTSTWTGKGALGIFPVSLALVDGALVLTHMLGLARRRVTLPCALEIGALVAMRPDVVAAQSDEFNTPGTEVRTGRYLRLVGDKTITVGCARSTSFSSHWDRATWRDGGKRRGCDIRLPVEAMLAVEYALVQRGVLRPAT